MVYIVIYFQHLSHWLEKYREGVSCCLPVCVFIETPSLTWLSSTMHPSSSFLRLSFRGVWFACTSEVSVVHHALCLDRGPRVGGVVGIWGTGFLSCFS